MASKLSLIAALAVGPLVGACTSPAPAPEETSVAPSAYVDKAESDNAATYLLYVEGNYAGHWVDGAGPLPPAFGETSINAYAYYEAGLVELWITPKVPMAAQYYVQLMCTSGEHIVGPGLIDPLPKETYRLLRCPEGDQLLYALAYVAVETR